MLTLALSLVTAVAYGCGDFLGGLATRRSHVMRVTAISSPVTLALLVAAYLLTGGAISPDAVIWGAVAGAAAVIVLICLYTCLSMGPMSVLSPTAAIVSAVLGSIAGTVLFGEVLSPLAIGAIVIALLAVVLVSGAIQRHTHAPRPLALILALLSGLFITVSLLAYKMTPTDSGLFPTLISRTLATAIFIAIFVAGRRRFTGDRSAVRTAMLAGALEAAATVFMLLAIRAGDIAIVSVVSSLYPAFTVLLATGFLHERLHRIQIVGLVFAAASVAVLAVA
jgi:drug/metabolite transporter (DMT)-like permease